MKATNKYNLPETLFKALTMDTYDYDPNVLSVTRLIDSPWIRYLEKEHREDIIFDASERLWALLGNAVHDLLDRTGNKYITELRLEKEVENTRISGKLDILDVTNGILQDYKITSVWNIIFNPEGKKEWINQLNCLAWLCRQHNLPINKLQIVAITRDWMKSGKWKQHDYPEIPISVIDIPLWTEAEQLAYIKDRIKYHKHSSMLTETESVYCTEIERWKKETTYAVKKEDAKRAIKVFNNELEAKQMATQKGILYYVETRPGIDERCVNYCDVNNFCPYWKEHYSNNEDIFNVNE